MFSLGSFEWFYFFSGFCLGWCIGDWPSLKLAQSYNDYLNHSESIQLFFFVFSENGLFICRVGQFVYIDHIFRTFVFCFDQP